MRLVLVVVVSAIALAACGGSADQVSAGATSVVSSPSPTIGPTVTEPAELRDAEALIGRLSQVIPEARLTKAYTAENDPNELLGRPGQYTSKAEFRDSRVPAKDRGEGTESGGGVEVFETPAEAQARKTYVDSVLKASPAFGTEYIYVEGSAVLRVTGHLTPKVAAEYEQAWPSVAGG